MVSDILFIILLVLLNGFFVAAEFAIVKVRLSQIHSKTTHSFNARIAENIVNNLDAYIAVSQLGITLSSLGLGWTGKPIVAKGIGHFLEIFNLALPETTIHILALFLAFILIVVLHFVFGELIPKSMAIHHPLNTTLAIAWPLRFFRLLFSPLSWLLNGFANFFLNILRLKPSKQDVVHSEEELKMIIAESAEGGAIEATERELIQNVFDFDDRFVWQILQPRTQIAAIEMGAKLDEAIELSLEEGYSRFPVYEESIDNILGFIHTKDLLMLSRQQNDKKQIKDIIRPIQYVSSNKKVMQLLRQFQKAHEQLAIVVNEFGGTVGLVTLEDIIEELVGEIQDEYDTETPIVEKANDNIYRIQAQNPLDEINDMVPSPFSEGDEYHTLSGLILKLSEEIPEEGDIIYVDEYQVKIVKMFQASPELVEAEFHPKSKEKENGEEVIED